MHQVKTPALRTVATLSRARDDAKTQVVTESTARCFPACISCSPTTAMASARRLAAHCRTSRWAARSRCRLSSSTVSSPFSCTCSRRRISTSIRNARGRFPTRPRRRPPADQVPGWGKAAKLHGRSVTIRMRGGVASRRKSWGLQPQCAVKLGLSRRGAPARRCRCKGAETRKVRQERYTH